MANKAFGYISSVTFNGDQNGVYVTVSFSAITPGNTFSAAGNASYLAEYQDSAKSIRDGLRDAARAATGQPDLELVLLP
jgi:hypothetical protein